MGIFVGETGRTIRLNAGIDMSNNTDLKIVFVRPDRTVIEKAKADGVELGMADIADPALGALLARRYLNHEVETGLFDVGGTWSVYVKYENHAITPPENLYGSPVRVKVRMRPELVPVGNCGCLSEN